MIITNLENSQRIESLHPLFKTLFDYVKSHDLLQMECGRIELKGDELYINNVNPECKKADEQVLEAHRKYIDVHIVLEGKETIAWKAIEDCHQVIREYDEKDDYMLYGDCPDNYITLTPGQLLIVYPEDPHAPTIGEGRIRKMIAKIKL